MQHVRICAMENVHIRMCATEDIWNMLGCVPLRIYATYQVVCHRGYTQHVRMCAMKAICNMLGCVPWRIRAVY